MPTYDGETPSWAELLRQAADERAEQMHTSIPGRVVSYDPTTQKASVQPVVMGIDPTTGQPQKLPVLPSMPVAFPRGGGFSIVWPLKPGDKVLVIFAERAIGQWLISGQEDAPPEHPWRFEMTDGIIIPGMGTFVDALESASDSDLHVGKDDGTARLVIQGDGTVVVEGAEVRLGSDAALDPVALSSLVDARFSTLDAQLKGMGLPGLPAGSVAANKVKAE